MVPTATVIAVLVNPTDPLADFEVRDAQAAALTLGVKLQLLRASTEAEINDAFTAVLELRAGVFVIATSVLFNGHIAQMTALATGHLVPTIYEYRQFVTAGGLLSYGPELIPPCRCLYRPDFQGRKTRRAAGPTGNES
jgi:putative ABC transport system substrate-binding protein